MSKSAKATVTSKGQVTIPQKVREDLGLSEGDRLDFVRLADGNYAIVPAKGSICDLEGILKRPGRSVLTIEQIQEAIERGAAGE